MGSSHARGSSRASGAGVRRALPLRSPGQFSYQVPVSVLVSLRKLAVSSFCLLSLCRRASLARLVFTSRIFHNPHHQHQSCRIHLLTLSIRSPHAPALPHTASPAYRPHPSLLRPIVVVLGRPPPLGSVFHTYLLFSPHVESPLLKWNLPHRSANYPLCLNWDPLIFQTPRALKTKPRAPVTVHAIRKLLHKKMLAIGFSPNGQLPPTASDALETRLSIGYPAVAPSHLQTDLLASLRAVNVGRRLARPSNPISIRGRASSQLVYIRPAQ